MKDNRNVKNKGGTECLKKKTTGRNELLSKIRESGLEWKKQISFHLFSKK